MTQYYIIGYLLDDEIQFFRTVSGARLIEKTEELKRKKIKYNTLRAKGFNISFR